MRKSVFREYFEAIVIAVALALFIRTFIVQAFKIPSGSMLETLQIGDHLLVSKFAYGIKMPFSGKVLIPIKEPQRGDIVVFKYPQDPSLDYIKRVIAVGGETVAVRNKQVFINCDPFYDEREQTVDEHEQTGRKKPVRCEGPRNKFGQLILPTGKLFVDGRLEDDHGQFKDARIIPASEGPRDNFGPVTVPEGKLFVMGDNRDNSYDSRFWGFVDLEAVRGKAFILYWSWDVQYGLFSLDRLASVRWSRIGNLVK